MRIYSKRLKTCLHKDNCEISFENFLLFYLLFFRLSLWKLSNLAYLRIQIMSKTCPLFLSLSCLLSLRFMKALKNVIWHSKHDLVTFGSSSWRPFSLIYFSTFFFRIKEFKPHKRWLNSKLHEWFFSGENFFLREF